ncbi:MAG: hypothetical protein ITG00_05430 [Flavobacterium sp.]|nr:hypothetical protein [Flavobacterium sp.]
MRSLLLVTFALLAAADAPKKTDEPSTANCIALDLKNNLLTVYGSVADDAKTFRLGFAEMQSVLYSANSDKKETIANIFSSEKLAIRQKLKDDCLTFDGTLANDLLRKHDGAVSLNFSEQMLCAISYSDLPKVVQDGGYKEIASNFKRGHFEVIAEINWTKYSFVFNTFAPESFIMRTSKNLSFLKEESIGMLALDRRTNSPSRARLYPFTKIYTNGTGYSSPILITPTIDKHTMGVGFIKGFDWIVDYRRSKVYFRKNHLGIDLYSGVSHKVAVNEEQIEIVRTSDSPTDYQIGDIVVAMDTLLVQPENLCEIYFRLLSDNDWRPLKIKVRRQ